MCDKPKDGGGEERRRAGRTGNNILIKDELLRVWLLIQKRQKQGRPAECKRPQRAKV